MDSVNTKTHCRYCREELTYDKERNCKVCLHCNPPRAKVAPPPKDKRNFIDVKVTEERVGEIFKELFAGDAVRLIVRDELENYHIQKPPVTKEEISLIPPTDNQDDWRAKARELGIPLFQRTKKDVLKDIEEKLVNV